MRRWTIAALAFTVAGCAALPPPAFQTPSTALNDTRDTRLGRTLAPAIAEHPGRTGIHPLAEPRDAFAARIALLAAADRSIDLQYYIWHGDTVGWLLLEAVWNAAERGVRVRMLLDDLTTRGMDDVFATLDRHPLIEVRYYNPLVPRGFRALNFLTEFERTNRRMHNKSLTVDNQVTVVGGRNVGDEYYAAGEGVAYVDLDLIAVGAAVPAVSIEFDRYWNSPSAYPAAQFGDGIGAEALRARFLQRRAEPAASKYLEAARRAPIVPDLLARRLPLEWTTARVVADDPAKTLDTTARTDTLLFPELVRSIGAPVAEFDLITPYFVPGEAGTAALEALARRGVRVRILTNSLAANDVAVVHAGYAKRRTRLLQAGVRLFELRPTAGSDADRRSVGGSSSSGLHAKTFAVDRARVFVGSFNFDPRSARLNTEMGLVVDSPALAGRLSDAFDAQVPGVAYEVTLMPDRSLRWIERTPAGAVHHATEPGTGWWQRLKIDALSVLPIEPLL